jgi:glyoxylase-like metal-dependent hydrolase (beta-lactamase superfamily II)
MRVHDFVDEGLGRSSYLVELDAGTAAVVDSPRFTTGHELLAARLGVRVAWTLDTHSHADDVTGKPALAARTSATFIAPAASRLLAPREPVEDDDSIALADTVTLQAVGGLGWRDATGRVAQLPPLSPLPPVADISADSWRGRSSTLSARNRPKSGRADRPQSGVQLC